jgi:outer membrane protein OmpA-like peptidoglycan-associated protein
MKLHNKIVAGTALCLVMSAAQLGAAPLGSGASGLGAGVPLERNQGDRFGAPLILAQAEECPADDPECVEEDQQEEAPAAEEAPAEEPAAEEPVMEEAPADEPVIEEAPAEEPVMEEAPVEEPVMEEAPAEEPVMEEAPAESVDEPTAAEPLPEEAPQPPAAEEAPAEEAAPPAEEAPPAAEQEAPPPAAEQEQELPEEQTPPAMQEAQPPADEQAPPVDGAVEPDPGEAAPPVTDGAVEPQPGDAGTPPVEGGAEPLPGEVTPGETPPPATDGAAEPVMDGSEAPILDSQKEELPPEEPVEGEEEVQVFEEDTGPAPTNDGEAQAETVPAAAAIVPVTQEEGRRVERREEGERRERREGTNVLREIGDRFVIQFNNQIIVESNDRNRVERDATEVYYEELPRGRTRETVVRPNGVQVVTIRDRYGDIVRRSRIMPDGREYVLVYADYEDRGERRRWRDPARELPPLRLTIPASEYILDAGMVEDPDYYYDFLDRPPVERVRRLYTVDEVRYSSRVRDMMPRIELDTLTFEFGSASIGDGEVGRLEGMAIAMERMLSENPAETFIIEGHTDAVGSDEANLALSDRRAESVALALTNVFDIPSENLVTQGYGERYLKINTQEPERENRRVVVRRITPLVAPVASR